MAKIFTKKEILESLITLPKSVIEEERKLPSNGEIAKCPSIYKIIKREHLQSYIDNGFQRTLAGDGGTCYGEGVYTSLKIAGSDGATRLCGWYGDVLLEGKVLGGFERYIMFDGGYEDSIMKLKAKYYGSSSISPEEQYLKLTGNRETARFLASYGERVNEYDDAIKVLRKNGIRGMIYRWSSGPTVLPFDFSSVVLFGYTVGVSSNDTFESIKSRMTYVLKDEKIKSRYEKIQNDWGFQLSGHYDKYDKESAVIVRTNREMYCIVQKDGKYNIVSVDASVSSNVKKPKEISDLWFSQKPTSPSIKDGVFQFRMNGIVWHATVFLPKERVSALWYPEDISKFNSPDINQTNQWIELNSENFQEAYQDYQQNLRNYGTVSESLTASFRKFLNEEITQNNVNDFLKQNWVRIWRATPRDTVESIFKNGQLRQFASTNDSWYGEGVYAQLNKNALQVGGRYGDAALEMIVVGGLKRFLIFDEEWARRVYGAKYTVEDQYHMLLPKDIADQEIAKIRQKVGGKTLLDRSGRTTEALHMMFHDGKGRHSDHDGPDASYYKKLFSKYNVRGAVYNGGIDGLCVVCWNFDEVVPFRYSLDRGATWRSDLFNFEHAKELSITNNDPVQKYRHKFLAIDDQIVKCNVNGKRISVTCVSTAPHKFNIIDISNGEKISPVDFDEKPMLSTRGTFTFKYKRVTFQGVINLPGADVPAFWFPENTNEFSMRADVSRTNDWVGFEDLDEAVNMLNGQTQTT